MYERAVKALRGLTPGSASTQERFLDVLANTKNEFQNGTAHISLTAETNAYDDTDLSISETVSSTLVLDQWNVDSEAWALNVRHGDANFMGRLYGVIRPATASSDWVDAGTPYVDAVDDFDGRTVRVYMPRTRSGDPNVKSGAPIEYAFERRRTGRAICVSSYMDDKIGTVKLWIGSPAAIPSGWRVCTDINGGDPRGKFVANYLEGDDDFGTLGQTGGAKTHTHADHELATEAVDVVVSASLVDCDLEWCTQQICIVGSTVGSPSCD